MKKTIIKFSIIAAMAMILTQGMSAQSNKKYNLSDMNLRQSENMLKLDMIVKPAEYHLKLNQRLEVTPVLHSEVSSDTLALPSFTIAGKNAYYTLLRENRSDGAILRAGHGKPYVYSAISEWQPWMDYSYLELQAHSAGCCGVPKGEETTPPIARVDYRPKTFSPSFHYEVPIAETRKDRRIEGKAYVNFPVNRTEIYPDYMVNPQELRKITSSVDSVRLNPDATVKSITLTGFASPEGPYSNNVRLAEGRTKAVKEYVRGQYTFPANVFHTNSVPEDWAGLRDSVASGILPDRAKILEFIDSNYPIEKRNDELRRRFPVSYEFLLKNVYPSLRHTNYAIDYVIRSYTDINEILKVYKERPQNLSLNEFFLAAQTFPIGSKEYDEVFATAVIYHPENDVANLNAANSAMNEGDYKRALMLLNRVKDNPYSIYGLGILNALEGNYTEAETLLKSAEEAGISEASAALLQVRNSIKRKQNVSYTE